MANTYYFFDLEARYQLKKERITFSLVGNDLFDNKTFKNYNIIDLSVS